MAEWISTWSTSAVIFDDQAFAYQAVKILAGCGRWKIAMEKYRVTLPPQDFMSVPDSSTSD
jgi:hypothetical protein